MAGPLRLFWLVVLAFHAAAASAWWWLMPGGFPILHPRTWAHRLTPLGVLAAVALAVFSARRGRQDALRRTLIAFPSAWAAASLCGRIVFPITLATIFAAPLAGAAAMALAFVATSRRIGPSPGRPMLAAAVAAALFGAAFPLALRPPSPDTRPRNGPMPALPEAAAGVASAGGASGPLHVAPGDGSLTFKAGRMTVLVRPLLHFLGRSPDGAPTVLVPAALREGRDLRLRTSRRDGPRILLGYRADDEATLSVDPGRDGGPIEIEATARLPRAIYSHLNAFCDLEVTGHRGLSLAFSPCPKVRVDVQPFGYPTGRPLRFAYLDAGGWFRVVEARSGEKGPFRELARGRLSRDEPLSITLHDAGTPAVRFEFDDWAAQAGTALSPTAGWGVPVNAIEFSLGGDAPGSMAGIYLTLSATSVGRGWDAVGHRAGTYRNRMRIVPLGGGARTGR